MKWFTEARFGLFIHWGVYSVPAGFYQGQPVGNYGEWIMEQARIPTSAYEKLAADFNPTKYDPKKCQVGCGLDKPTGNVINYVREELEAMGIPAAEWKKGGYRITTTINQSAQKAAEGAARRVKGSPMEKTPNYYRSALVAIDPSNGRVMAYYGGDNGTGFDYAGLNNGGTSGGHAPGSTFKIYTLAAAVLAEIEKGC